MGGVASAWNPSRLTGLAATLLPALSRSSGLLWQNTAKTTPSTADGDPVRVAVCPFTAVEFTAPSDAARPLLWDEGSGKWSLSFDGVDDQLQLSPRNIGAGSFTISTRFRATSVGQIYTESNTGLVTPFVFYQQNSTTVTGNFRNDAGTELASGVFTLTSARDAWQTGFFRRTGNSWLLQNGGGSNTTTQTISTPTVNAATVGCLRRATTGEFIAMRTSGLIVQTAAEADLTQLTNYLGAL